MFSCNILSVPHIEIQICGCLQYTCSVATSFLYSTLRSKFVVAYNIHVQLQHHFCTAHWDLIQLSKNYVAIVILVLCVLLA